MATDLPGFGSKFQVYITAAYVDVPQISEFSWDGMSVGVRNPTALESGRKRKKPGLPDYGSIKIKAWFDPNNTTHQNVRDRVKTPSQTLQNFKVIYADGMTTPAAAIVSGFVSEFNQSGFVAEDGTLETDFTVEVDDITSFTAGA